MRNSKNGSPPKRSAGALMRRRDRQHWPESREFRILSIDGGGIRGIFPAAFLSGLEQRYLNGESVTRYFDLVSGTSTGGIIALGLAAGLDAEEIAGLYIDRGSDIFPPLRGGLIGCFERPFRFVRKCARYRYDRDALSNILHELFGTKRLKESRVRLCIPSYEGRYGEVYIFKTPHHPDFRNDANENMKKVALATAAAPTFFQPLQDRGYTFVDGGVWANNPLMVALVDALSCFRLSRYRIRILSLGCGETRYTVNRPMVLSGGLFAWRKIIEAAIQLQSQNALGQAGLLIGADRIVRVEPDMSEGKIELDDWKAASARLPRDANVALEKFGERISSIFLTQPTFTYKPLII